MAGTFFPDYYSTVSGINVPEIRRSFHDTIVVNVYAEYN